MKLLLPSLILASVLVLVPMNAEAKTYEHPAYTVDYPNGCKLEKGGKYETSAFNVECKGDVGIQIESGASISEYMTGGTVQEQLDDLTSVMERGFDTETVESGVDKYTINNVSAPYVIGTYEQEFTNFMGLPAESEDWVLMNVLVDIGNNQKVVAEYRNDAKNFDKQLPIAEKIFKSIKGTGVVMNSTDSDSGISSESAIDTICSLAGNALKEAQCKNAMSEYGR